MSISIVIPVYNEELSLKACLESIAAQTVRPMQVIVVDNNSTDSSVAVAKSFPFVTVVNEPRQGVIHARSLGFDLAAGDIIGRIDADTILDPDWVQKVENIFADSSVAAVSGSVDYYDVIASKLSGKIDTFFRKWLSARLKKDQYLYGANMAVRRSSWEKVRAHLCKMAGIHEDFDLALHLQELGLKVIFDESLHAGVSIRRVENGFIESWRYALVSPRTYAHHGKISRLYMYPVIACLICGYWIIALCHRLYSSNLLEVKRPNPVTFVD